MLKKTSTLTTFNKNYGHFFLVNLFDAQFGDEKSLLNLLNLISQIKPNINQISYSRNCGPQDVSHAVHKVEYLEYENIKTWCLSVRLP